MSTKNKKAPATGIRYSDTQKKEVVNFVAQYNSANGRGGQSAAAKKFKVTPLTISAWLKSAGAKAPTKKAKAAKVAKSGGKSKKGVRYSPEKKKEVVDFVTAYNASKGRGGQNQAAKRFNLSVLTVSAWLKAAGAKKSSKRVAVKVEKARKVAKKPAKSNKVLNELEALKAAIRKLIS
jgi:transposase-like protein